MAYTVSVCMGSSCFSRGNKQMVELIENYLQENHLENLVELKGNLCEGLCSIGPNIRINGTIHHAVDAPALLNILKEQIRPQRL